MGETIIVACITGGLAFLGTLISNLTAHSKTMYRIEQLEKKQDIHNGVIERVYSLEKITEVQEERIRVANHRIDDLEKGKM
jgi:hypothetical protein